MFLYLILVLFLVKDLVQNQKLYNLQLHLHHLDLIPHQHHQRLPCNLLILFLKPNYYLILDNKLFAYSRLLKPYLILLL
tara:strand:- start:57 stop:293 length:237 start_codon:yes stop_codon:yes gene_type:complete